MTYMRYKDCSDLKYANTVNSQIILNMTEPMTTMMVGATLFPMPLAAAVALSMKADTQ